MATELPDFSLDIRFVAIRKPTKASTAAMNATVVRPSPKAAPLSRYYLEMQSAKDAPKGRVPIQAHQTVATPSNNSPVININKTVRT